MKKKIILLCLLSLLLVALVCTGVSLAKYASTHNVTTGLEINIEASKYKLTLDGNGGVFEEDLFQIVEYKGTYGELPTPEREGYSFDGWYTEKTGGSQIKAGDTVEITQDTTVYAHWTPNAYQIQFDGNGAEGSMTGISAFYGQSVTLTANSFIRIGYKFTGWNTAPDGSGTNYADEASVINLTAAPGGIVTLYAQWDSQNYIVRFHANGGNGDMADMSIAYGQTVVLTANRFSRIGYKFTGWNTEPNGSGTNYADEASVSNLTAVPGGTVTLYAQWVSINYTVRFDANSGNGDMADMNAVYDEELTLSPNRFTRTGYGFTGWNTEPDGSGTDYADGASVRNLTAVPGGIVTLYAQWVSQNYIVRFNANGGDGTMADMKAVYDVELTLSPNSFSRTGYKFIGWNTKADGSGISYGDEATVENLPSGDGSVAVLYAQWEKLDIYTLVYDANGGTNAPTAQTGYADTETQSYTFDITADIPTYVSPSGVSYDFLGWSEDSSLTAALQYSADGINAESSDQDLEKSITLDRTGDTTTKTLYAVWGVTYRLSYDAGSGSGVPNSVEQFGRLTGCTFDVDFSVTPTWEEHEFKYWTTNVHYVAGEETDRSVMYPNPSKIVVSAAYSDEILYARYYNQGALTVTYHANVPYLGVAYNMPGDASITAEVEGATVPYTISYNVKPTIKKSGTGISYNLLGWASSPDSTEVEYTAGQQVQLSRYNDQATTLYAVWDVMPIIICADITNIGQASGGQIYLNATDSDAITDGFYWNDNCVNWILRSKAGTPEEISVSFYTSWINSKNNLVISGFSRTKDGTVRDAIDLVNASTGNISGYGTNKFNLDQTMWAAKKYDEETKAYFIPIYTVYDEYVLVYQYLNYCNNLNSNRVAIHSYDYNARYLASMYNSGLVSIPFFSKNGNEYTTKNFWLYPYNLRNGTEYSVIGWAWNSDATEPDGQIIAVDTGLAPFYAPSGRVNTYLSYDSAMYLNIKDADEGICTVSVNGAGVTCYTYSLNVIYEEVVDSNTFRILLEYSDEYSEYPTGDLGEVITQEDSYTYFAQYSNSSQPSTKLYYSCADDKCLPAEYYNIVGWSLSKETLYLDLLQYPVGHPLNGSIAQEVVFASNPPLTVSINDDAYDEDGDFYYKKFYAVYAKTIHFNENYSGTVSNMPDSVSAYTHYGFENDTAYITIPDNVPTRSEALFLGWATELNGDVVYYPGDVVSVEAAEVTLYAVWQNKYDFTLVYDWNYEGGTQFSVTNKNTVSHIEIQIISSIPARDGYRFLGWAETPDAETPAYSNPAQEGTSATIVVTATVPNETTEKMLYAVWEKAVLATSSTLLSEGANIASTLEADPAEFEVMAILDLRDVTVSGLTENKLTIRSGGTVELILATADAGYHWGESIVVVIGETTCTIATADGTITGSQAVSGIAWDAATGRLTIPADLLEKDKAFTLIADAYSTWFNFTISSNVENVTVSGTDQTSTYPGENVVLTITPAEGYAVPETFSVTINETEYIVGSNGIAYSNGTLTIPAVLLSEGANVTVNVSGQEIVAEVSESGEEPALE